MTDNNMNKPPKPPTVKIDMTKQSQEIFHNVNLGAVNLQDAVVVRNTEPTTHSLNRGTLPSDKKSMEHFRQRSIEDAMAVFHSAYTQLSPMGYRWESVIKGDDQKRVVSMVEGLDHLVLVMRDYISNFKNPKSESAPFNLTDLVNAAIMERDRLEAEFHAQKGWELSEPIPGDHEYVSSKAITLNQQIQWYLTGLNRELPKEWEMIAAKNDPDYETYMRLKEKFGYLED
jgi:hypothetical protein